MTSLTLNQKLISNYKSSIKNYIYTIVHGFTSKYCVKNEKTTGMASQVDAIGPPGVSDRSLFAHCVGVHQHSVS